MNDIQIEAGLWTQIRKLKKRIDSLDMDKVDPVELKSAIDSLKDMESRYSDIQEKKKQRRLDKETKAAPMPIESAPETPAPTPDAVNPELIPPIDAPVEKSADVEVDAIKNEDVISSFVDMSNPKAHTAHVFIEQVSPDVWNLVNYNTVIATNEGGTVKLNYKYYSQTTRRIQNKIWWTAKQAGLTVIDAATGKPMELGNRPEKKVEEPVEQEQVVEEVPMAAEKKEATTSKYALDDVVEPVYGSAGSYGRVMRYDADKDMAYVHWDAGKLQAEHGFGAYKGTDLRKRASLDKKARGPFFQDFPPEVQQRVADAVAAHLGTSDFEAIDDFINRHNDWDSLEEFMQGMDIEMVEQHVKQGAQASDMGEPMGEPMGDVWTLESQDEEFAANILSGIAQKAIEGDVGEQQYLSSLWGEKWPQVKKKLEAEGSTWYVWWMDGVHEFMRGMQDAEEPVKEADSSIPQTDTKCESCGKELGPEAFLSKWPVCGDCTKKRHKKVTQSAQEGLNGYIGYYKGKQFETYAKTSYEAQRKMALEHGVKKPHEITVVLAEKGGEPVVHKPQDVVGGSEQDGIGYGGDRGGMAVAPKRDEDVSLTSGKYTGDMDKDLKVLMPHIVADGVSQNDRELSDWLVERARQIYKHNPEWGKKVARENDAARDFLWQFMEHWAKSKQSGAPMESSLTASSEPAAMGWWMREQDARPKHSSLEEDGNPDAQDVVDTYINGNISDARAWLAKNPDLFPEAMRLMREFAPKDAQRFVDLTYPYRKTALLNKAADHIQLDPMFLELAQDEIASGSDMAHDVAAEHGQMFENIKHMQWFVEAVAEELQHSGIVDSNTGIAPEGTAPQKEAVGNPGEGQVMELNIANRKWTAKRTSGAGSPDAWVIFDDQGKQIMAITMSERELSQPELEQIVFNELGKKDLVRATLNVDLSIMKKGHKVKLVAIDLGRKEAKFASLESSTLAGWTKLEKFDITIEAGEREPKLDRHCKECGAKIPLSFEDNAVCRDCARKKDHPHKEAALMPLSNTDTTVRIKSSQTLLDLAKNCPDCYKKFLKFAKEKGLHIQADDITEHVEQMRTKMTQNKEVLQTQTQAAEVVPETVETEAALPPKPTVPLPDGMKWFYNKVTNTWEMIADDTLRY